MGYAGDTLDTLTCCVVLLHIHVNTKEKQDRDSAQAAIIKRLPPLVLGNVINASPRIG